MRTPTAQPKQPPEARPGDPPDTYSEGWASVRVRGTFAPKVIEARPGERLRLVFRREETAACSDRVLFPSLGKSIMLPPFEDVSVDLGPLPPGEHEFSCGLGVLRGRILVAGQPAAAPVDTGQSKAAFRTDRMAVSGSNGSRMTSGSANSTGSQPHRRFRPMKRPTINIAPAERLGRVFVGLVGLVGGLILLGSAAGAVVAVLEVLLIVAGLDLIVTGALGYCPLYRKLGHVPASLRRPS